MEGGGEVPSVSFFRPSPVYTGWKVLTKENVASPDENSSVWNAALRWNEAAFFFKEAIGYGVPSAGRAGGGAAEPQLNEALWVLLKMFRSWLVSQKENRPTFKSESA